MNYSQLIEKYLKCELAGEELKKFLEDLQKDPELAQDVETLRSFQKVILKYHKKLIKSTEQGKEKLHREKSKIEQEVETIIEKYHSRPFDVPVTGEEEFKETVKKVIKDKGKIRGDKMRRLRRYLSLAACLIIISSIPILVFLSKSKRDIGSIYECFYKPLNIDYQTRDVRNINDLIFLGAAEFANGNYTKAIEILNTIQDTSVSYPSLHMLKGISYMELEDFNKAVIELECIYNENYVFNTVVTWYLGLCYLKLDKLGEAEILFKSLANNEPYYAKDAKTILKILKKYKRNKNIAR